MLSIVDILPRSVPPALTSAQAEPAADRAQQSDRDTTSQHSGIVDTIDISRDALRAAESAAHAAKAAYWADFYPGRDGFSTTNLAAAVVDPGAQPFSESRSFAEVAQLARQSIDTRYEAMRDSGQPFRWNAAEGAPKGTYGGLDINAAFGELDRRALYAVASNEEGLFSTREQQAASGIMRQQQGNAMGFASGPIDASNRHVDPHLGNHETRFVAMNRFLDSVSIEERTTSAEWAQQRASGQRTVERMAQDRGEEPETFTTGNALLSLLLEAIDAQRSRIEEGDVQTAYDLPPLLEGYEDRIAQTIENSRRVFDLGQI